VLPYRPVLEDFYKPTPEHNYYETVVASIIGGVNGYVAYRFIVWTNFIAFKMPMVRG